MNQLGMAGANRTTDLGAAITTDPDVPRARTDGGYSWSGDTLRATDISVGDDDDGPGWANAAPRLAIEYAGSGQDETSLRAKIGELLAAGTKHIWDIRLVGHRRVEVYEPNVPAREARPGDMLWAPGILRNPVPVSRQKLP